MQHRSHPRALRLASACLAALALAGAATGAAAQSKTLYVGMNGGDMERAFTQHVFPDFEKANDVKIVVVPGTSTDILAKAQAFKDKPQTHLMFLDDGVMFRAMSMGLCAPLADSPELAELHPSARLPGNMAVGIDMGMTGIAYNTKLFKENGWDAPTSWMDFADPKYKGKVVFQSASSSSFGLHGFLMFNRIQGGDEGNVDPGFKAWPKTIGPNVLEYIPSSAKIAEMVQTGEAAIFPLTPTAVGRLQKRDIPVAYAQPKEGSVILMVAQCVVANNSEPELSQKLAAYLLSAPAQEKALEFANHFPSNTKAVPVDAMKEAVTAFNGYLENAKLLDWNKINENRPAWNQRWNRQIER